MKVRKRDLLARIEALEGRLVRGAVRLADIERRLDALEAPQTTPEEPKRYNGGGPNLWKERADQAEKTEGKRYPSWDTLPTGSSPIDWGERFPWVQPAPDKECSST